MGMASRVLDNSLKSGLNVFCRRRLLSSSGYWHCYTSVSSQIDSPAIGYVKDTAEYIDTKLKQRTISSTIKVTNPQSTIQNFLRTYIHTYKQAP